MIKISLDEAYVFDILSILHLKIDKNASEELKKINSQYFNTVKNELIEQLGEEKFLSIMNSSEYKDLYDANNKTFHLVDISKDADGLAKIVLESNNHRYDCKKALQKAFFDIELNEVKI
jgi:hypothetical protein